MLISLSTEDLLEVNGGIGPVTWILVVVGVIFTAGVIKGCSDTASEPAPTPTPTPTP